jgi:hypothetical protein
MLGSIQRISRTAGNLGNWAEKVIAAKSAILSKIEEPTEKNSVKQEFKFTRPLKRSGRVEAKSAPKQNGPHESRIHFLNTYFKENILTSSEIHIEEEAADDFSDLIAAEEIDMAEAFKPPLLLGFDDGRDCVEVEYMVVADPDNGDCIAPEISVSPSKDGKSGNIFLNGKLVACVAGGENLQVEDIELVKVEV